MSLMSSVNASLIGQLIAFVSAGTLLDILIPDRQRTLIASYIFRRRGSHFSEFEKVVISALVGVFLKRNPPRRVSKRKVFAYSLVTAFTFLSIFSLATGKLPEGNGPSQQTFGFAVAVLLLAMLEFPFDLFSIHLTKKIFLADDYRSSSLLWRWILATFTSLLPAAFVMGLALVTIGFRPVAPADVTMLHAITVAAVLSGGSAVLLNLAQALIIISGFCVRLAGYLFSPSEETGNTRLREHPITLCFLVGGVVTLLADLAL